MNPILNQYVDANADQLVNLRRHLHRHPELSGHEFATTRFLAEKLDALGLSFRIGPEERGLVVDLGPADASRRLAMRADIDAIPVDDTKNVDYRSSVANVMHACGHDAHSTILIGALGSLKKWFDSEPRDFAIRAIFQPEEETARGAQRLIEWGALDGVDAIIGAHVDPSRQVGTIGLRSGAVSAHCDEIFVEIEGKGGHAARPHQTIDPIAAAVQFVNSCYGEVPRAINSQQPVVLSFASIQGGERSNVIPDMVRMCGTLRSLDSAARQKTIDTVNRIASGVAMATGAQIHVRFGLMVPAVVADVQLTEMVRKAAINLLGIESVSEIPHASMGGEDFAFYCQQIPAAFIRLGSAGDLTGDLPLHNSGFDIDERVLTLGAKVFAHSVVDYFSD